MMTKEAIETRIAELRTQMEQAVANVHAIEGAIQDCQYWLTQVEADDHDTR